MEQMIAELKNGLKADRMSCNQFSANQFSANQFRLYLRCIRNPAFVSGRYAYGNRT